MFVTVSATTSAKGPSPPQRPTLQPPTSTFRPAVTGRASDGNSATANKAAGSTGQAVIPDQPHILIVDDDPALRLLLATYLASAGFRISEAADGSHMHASLASGDVDLVLLDIGLPGQDGLSLLRAICCEHNVRVIIVSCRSELIDRVVGLEVGADDYVTKPFNLRELLARIRSVLRDPGK